MADPDLLLATAQSWREAAGCRDGVPAWGPPRMGSMPPGLSAAGPALRDHVRLGGGLRLWRWILFPAAAHNSSFTARAELRRSLKDR